LPYARQLVGGLPNTSRTVFDRGFLPRDRRRYKSVDSHCYEQRWALNKLGN
jgi:hypothetical protein